jgi:hypothetical protein
MAVIAGFMALFGIAGIGVAFILFIVRLIFKRGWDKKKIAMLGGTSLALLVFGTALGIASVPDEYEAGLETLENKTIKSNNVVETDKSEPFPKESQGVAPDQVVQSTPAPTSSSTTENKLEDKPESKPVEQELSYEEWLKNAIIETVGDKTNYDKPRIESIIFLDEEETDMEITLWADDNLTRGLIRDGVILQSTEILRQIYSDKRAKCVLLYWLFPVKDVYGNKQALPIMQIKLTRETAAKINWQEFNSFNLPYVADKFHIHPDLQ